MAHDHRRVEEVARQAMAYPEALRSAFLSGACWMDPLFRQRVEARLAAGSESVVSEPSDSGLGADDADILLDDSILPGATLSDVSSAPMAAVPEETAGSVIGRYRLLDVLGEGGFGKVWQAEQTAPVRRQVALKILKLGMDTQQVVARFEAERQTLARMDHPNIAMVLDAGATRTGRPFFVMELVEGQPITAFCDQAQMNLRERLELFVKVCQAIQHAHQKGIIHRDIKPSNILVTSRDGVALPKVIDFGIAKATQQDLSEWAIQTQCAQLIGTPAYMSPEQAESGRVDIDTRSDIYSLGVVLYELLTGVTPFESKSLLASGLDEMRRIIREQEPLRPSARIAAMRGGSSGSATGPGPDRAKDLPWLKGDLDWIVVKCLEKDRTRRYETANALAQEIHRFLNEEPVRARPPSGLYRFQKTVRRHKALFVGGCAVLAALVVGLWFATVSYFREFEARQLADRARLEADAAALKSQQVATFLKDMLRGVGPSVAQGRDTTMLREILEATAGRVGKDLSHQQDIQSELRTVIGSTYGELGDHTQAEAMHREALRLRREAFGEKHPLVAESLTGLGRELRERGAYAEAETVFRQAVEMARELGLANSRTAADALNGLAVLLVLKGNRAEARAVQSEAVDIYRRLYGEAEPRLADLLNDMGVILFEDGRGDLAAAESALREALRIRKRHSGDLSIMNSMMLHNLGRIHRGRGDLAQSEASFREALVILEKAVGERHPRTAITRHELALTLLARGQPPAAEDLLRQALAVYREKLGASHAYVAEALHDLGRVLLAQRRPAEAATQLAEAVTMRRQALGDSHADVAASLREWAAARAELGPEERNAALGLVGQSLDISRKQWAASPAQLAPDLVAGSGVFQRAREWARAEALLKEAWKGVGDAPSVGDPSAGLRGEIASRFIQLYEDWDKAEPGGGRAARAEEWRSLRETPQKEAMKK